MNLNLPLRILILIQQFETSAPNSIQQILIKFLSYMRLRAGQSPGKREIEVT
jgi:hypothetical protein